MAKSPNTNNSKRTTRSARQQRNQARNAQRRAVQVVRRDDRLMHDKCITDFAESLVDPFNGPATCMPYPPGVPSQKAKVFARGIAYTGAAGVGFVSWNPGFDQTSAFGHVSSVFFAGTSIQNAAAGVTTRNPNSAFGGASFGTSGISWRVVSAGIRVRYSGTELDRGGVLIGLAHPANESVLNFGFDTMSAYRSADISPVKREWTSVVYTPVAPQDFDYHDVGVITDQPILGIVMTAPAVNTPISFEYEIFMNVELIGKFALNLSPSPSRIEAASDVINVVRGLADGLSLSTIVAGAQSAWGIARHVGLLWKEAHLPEIGRIVGRIGL